MATSDTARAPRLTVRAHEDAPDARRLEDAHPNLEGTPRRVVRSYGELFAGLHAGSAPDLRTFPNPERYGQMVAVTDIPFHSLCAHHLRAPMAREI